MPINYYISRTMLQNKRHYVGRISLKGSYDRDMLLARMLQMGTSIGKEDIEGVLSLFEKTVYNVCLEGNKVTLDGFLQITPSLRGTFDGESASFDKSKNEVYLTAQISSAFNKGFSSDACIEKILATEKKPYLFEVYDNETGETNLCVTHNNIVTIYGEQMKFDEKSAEEYLHFVNEANPTQFAAITKCQKATDKEIVFLMPETAYAKGYFEVGSKMSASTLRMGKSPSVEVK
jgi:hypothetical protein